MYMHCCDLFDIGRLGPPAFALWVTCIALSRLAPAALRILDFPHSVVESSLITLEIRQSTAITIAFWQRDPICVQHHG
jgi:hypothetical protein